MAIWEYVKLCWKFGPAFLFTLFFQEVFMVLKTMCGLIFPKYIIDSIFAGDAKAGIIYCAIFIGTIIFNLIMQKIITGLLMVQKAKLEHNFRFYLNNRFISVSFESIEKESFLDLKAKAENYIYGFNQSFGEPVELLFSCIGDIFALILIAAIISQLSPVVVGLIVVIALLNKVVFKRIIGARMQRHTEMSVHARRISYFNNTVQDFQYGKEIRNNGLFDWLSKKYKEKFEEYYSVVKKMSWNFTLGVIGLVFIDASQLIIGYVYVIRSAILGAITVGEFSMQLDAITRFASNFQFLMQKLTNLSEYKIYYEFYKEYMAVPVQSSFGNDKPTLPETYDIEFENVSFKYGGAENFALKDVSVKFNSKERIAIIGENGAGKSTFVKLLMRLYEPTEGRILVNGIDIKNIDYDYYQTWIAAVFQDFKLFSFSIQDNIVFDKLNSKEDSERLEKIVKATGLDEILVKLDKGMDTLVYRDFDEDGFTPSGGQGQKIAIARAAYKNAPIVILDEPTAALDPRAENQIYEQFDEFFKDRCSLYISHRMAVTKFSSRTLVFDKGHIIQDGTHDTLVASEGKYKELYDLQAQYYV